MISSRRRSYSFFYGINEVDKINFVMACYKKTAPCKKTLGQPFKGIAVSIGFMRILPWHVSHTHQSVSAAGQMALPRMHEKPW